MIRTVGPIGDYTTVQAAINAAGAGDVLLLAHGWTFTEAVVCPDKGVLASDILITSDATAVQLPAAGYRTNPSYAAFMPTIQSPGAGEAAVQFAVGANHYKFQHIHLPGVPNGLNSIVSIGFADSTQQFESQEPADITIDQCYIHGGSICGQNRAIHTAGKRISITNNYIDEIKAVSQDSQAIAGWNGHGPITVTNNFLGGVMSEPFLLGGSDPSIRTFMTVTGTPTNTSADVTCSEASHTLAEVSIGQTIAILTGGVWKITTLTSKSSNGASATIGFTSVGAAPDIGTNKIKAGAICDGLLFRYNHVKGNASLIDGVFPKRTAGPTVTPGTGGSLSAGTYYYKIQSYTDRGYYREDFTPHTRMRGAPSPQAQGMVTSGGKNTLTWTAHDPSTGLDFERVWRGTTSGSMTQYRDVAAGTTTLVDDGTLSWTNGTPSGGDTWTMKNLFEIKACVNAQIDSNIFEYHWVGVDQGWPLWFKTVDQDGTAPYLWTHNIIFEYNILRHCMGFAELHGIEAEHGGRPGPLTDITIRHNLCYDSGTSPWNEGNQELYAIIATEGIVNGTFDHNTIVHVDRGNFGGALKLDDQVVPLVNFKFTNNMIMGLTYPSIQSSVGEGTDALNASCTSWTVAGNALANTPSTGYPTGNFYPTTSFWQAQFVAYTVDGVGADYRIANGSPYNNAGTDFKDIGADINAILSKTANVISGNPIGDVVLSMPVGALNLTGQAIGQIGPVHKYHGRFGR